MLLNLGISSAVSMTSPLSVGITEALVGWQQQRRRRRRQEQAQAQAREQGQGQGRQRPSPPALPSELPSPRPVSSAVGAAEETSTARSAVSTAFPAASCSAAAPASTASALIIDDASPTSLPRLPTLLLHLLGLSTGLLYVTRAGVHWVALADHYIPLYLTVVVGLSECLTVSLCLGCEALVADLAPSDQRHAWWWKFSGSFSSHPSWPCCSSCRSSASSARPLGPRARPRRAPTPSPSSTPAGP